ncbi:MAG: extracellular solute-binding protein [Anaerolineales bacterium]|nr:extracellular solute-binding protein [Anaerolineales bacterium]
MKDNIAFALLLIAGLSLAACQPTEIEVTRIVKETVIETVEETVIVEGTPVLKEVTRIIEVEKEVIVTPTPDSESAQSEEQSETGGAAQCEKIYDVNYMMLNPWVRGAGEPPEELDKNPWKKYILDNFCIDMHITYGPAEDPMTKVNAMIASGTMPDMIQTSALVGDPSIKQWVNQGVLIELDDWMNKYPKMWEVFDSPDDWRYLQIYGKTYGVAIRADKQFNILQVRKDWLDKLGLSMPTTLEDVEELARAFTFNDPDGNGLDDTYGFTAGSGGEFMYDVFGQTASIFAPLGAFPGNNHIRIEDNQVIFDVFSDEARNAIAWWKRMIEEGVVDPDWATNSLEQYRETVVQGRVGIITAQFQLMLEGSPGVDVMGSDIKAFNPDAEWVQVPAITGPFGTYSEWVRTPVANAFYLTLSADSEPGKLDALVRFISEAMDDESETYRFMAFGPMGIILQKVDPETNKILEVNWDNFEGWQCAYMQMRDGNEEYWKAAIMGLDPTRDFLWDNYMMTGSQPQIPNVSGMVVAHDRFPDLQTYFQEMHMKFAIGSIPLDDEHWNEFVDEAMTTYHGQEIIEDATNQLRDFGLVE